MHTYHLALLVLILIKSPAFHSQNIQNSVKLNQLYFLLTWHIQCECGQLSYALNSWRHSARAAARFSFKLVRK